jgi:hypothetical protein
VVAERMLTAVAEHVPVERSPGPGTSGLADAG